MNRNKICILLAYIVFLLNYTFSVEAAVITWNGGGNDNYASNPANWSGNMSPQNGDKVVFDGTSVRNASWNLSVTLFSFTKTAGYTGKITKISGTSLTIGKFATWTGNGADEFASTSANWAGNTVPVSGDRVLFDGSAPAKHCKWNINVLPSIVVLSSDYAGIVTLEANLALSESLTVSGGTLALNNKALNVDGYVLINPGGIIDATSSTITVKGNWANWGQFIHGTSTVIFSGIGQTVYGDTTFYNLEKIAACPGDTLYFGAGSSQTILGRLTLKGIEGCLLALKSTQDGQQWYIDPRGTRNISFASIKDMNNTNFVDIVTIQSNDAGGNSPSVKFGGSQCVCLDEKLLLAQIIYREGGLL